MWFFYCLNKFVGLSIILSYLTRLLSHVYITLKIFKYFGNVNTSFSSNEFNGKKLFEHLISWSHEHVANFLNRLLAQEQLRPCCWFLNQTVSSRTFNNHRSWKTRLRYLRSHLQGMLAHDISNHLLDRDKCLMLV